MIIFCFQQNQTFDSVHEGLVTTVGHSPLLKRSPRVAFYVRRSGLGACRWQPARGSKHNMTRCSGRLTWTLWIQTSRCGLLYFEDEVWRRSWSHCGSENPVVVRVNKRLVQVQNQDLPLHCIYSWLKNGILKKVALVEIYISACLIYICYIFMN